MTSGTTVSLAEIELPTSTFMYRGYDLAPFVHGLVDHSVTYWQDRGLMRPSGGNLGIVIANLAYEGRYHEVWDDPRRLVGFAGANGDEGIRFAWNAARKLRPLARMGGSSTLALVRAGFADWINPVESNPDDPNYGGWGDFPHGGAVEIGADTGKHRPAIATSALAAKEDHAWSTFVGLEVQYLLDEIDNVLDVPGYKTQHPFVRKLLELDA